MPIMTAPPVIERELRAGARHAFNYRLRVPGAAVLLSVFTLISFSPEP